MNDLYCLYEKNELSTYSYLFPELYLLQHSPRAIMTMFSDKKLLLDNLMEAVLRSPFYSPLDPDLFTNEERIRSFVKSNNHRIPIYVKKEMYDKLKEKFPEDFI